MRPEAHYLVITGLTLLAGLFTIWIQVRFVLPVPTGSSAYIRLIASVTATLCLLVGLIPFRSIVTFYAAGIGSTILALTMLELLVRITPIAQGNNDSGEVFWFLMLPMILFFSQASLAYLRLQKATKSEVTP
jgi:hypothetical protein